MIFTVNQFQETVDRFKEEFMKRYDEVIKKQESGVVVPDDYGYLNRAVFAMNYANDELLKLLDNDKCSLTEGFDHEKN